MKFKIMMLLVMISSGAFAQSALLGQIRHSESNEPLHGAYIYITDLHRGAVTNDQGSYRIDDLPNGNFLVEVSYAGFSNKIIDVTIAGETQLNVDLSPSVTEVTDIVVTARSATTKRQIDPVPTVVISSILDQNRISTNLIDAVAQKPGVWQLSTGNAVSKPIIRGMGYNRVVVLNDNIRQEGQQWGDEHGVEIDEYSVDRVEIIKGPGSLMYGSDAMAGVVHFLAPKPVNDGEVTGQLVTNYQSNAGLIGMSAMNSGNIKGLNWLARVSSKQAGNYQNAYDGKVYNSGFNELNMNGSVGIDRKWGYSKLTFSRFDQEIGMVEGERDDAGNFIRPVVVSDSTIEEQRITGDDLNGYSIGVPRQQVVHQKLASSSKFYWKRSVLSLNLAYQQNDRMEFANPFESQDVELAFKLKTFNYDVRYRIPDLSTWKTTIGMNGMQQSSFNGGEEYLIPEYQLFDAGIYAITQRSFSRLHVSGGLRYDLRSIDSDPLYFDGDGEVVNTADSAETTQFEAFKVSYSNFSGSVGASYELRDDLTLKLNASRGFRLPNMAELGSNGIHEGTFRYEIGNNDLRPETSLQVDAGLAYNGKHVTFELSLFNNAIQNFIYLSKLQSVSGGDSIVLGDDDAPAFKFTQGQALLRGGEFIMDIHPHPMHWLHLENSLGFVQGVLLNQPDSAHYLPFIPPMRWRSEVRADIEFNSEYIDEAFVRIDYTHVFDKDDVYLAYGTETVTPGYGLLNFGLGMHVLNSRGKRMMKVSLNVQNALDQAYQSHLSRLKYAPENAATGRVGVYNMGRNVSLRIVVPLTFRDRSKI